MSFVTANATTAARQVYEATDYRNGKTVEDILQFLELQPNAFPRNTYSYAINKLLDAECLACSTFYKTTGSHVTTIYHNVPVLKCDKFTAAVKALSAYLPEVSFIPKDEYDAIKKRLLANLKSGPKPVAWMKLNEKEDIVLKRLITTEVLIDSMGFVAYYNRTTVRVIVCLYAAATIIVAGCVWRLVQFVNQ
jgi:hypothetical protein